jgi:hypothetical protein
MAMPDVRLQIHEALMCDRRRIDRSPAASAASACHPAVMIFDQGGAPVSMGTAPLAAGVDGGATLLLGWR